MQVIKDQDEVLAISTLDDGSVWTLEGFIGTPDDRTSDEDLVDWAYEWQSLPPIPTTEEGNRRQEKVARAEMERITHGQAYGPKQK
jgi:hypothetical protein